ncbi:antifungal protein ginkbilobin-like protein [Rhodamnia argentea]|uniref:Antifungal protein ginkbilobin-like protein n=1 Tax=Rhodamnia argentea TaxID=178133 RepID=A0A8B8QI67_9MYRT|nr:antifungal protein ginkbilobin-like protein [Rhodamnia argentea]
MAIPRLKLTAAIVAASSLLLLLGVARGAPDTTVRQVLCNSEGYTAGDPFAANVAYVVADLEAATPGREGYDYANISPYPNAFAYGHATCGRNLTGADCGTCLGAAKRAMLGTCASRIGARAVLVDCGMRYEQYPFSD